MSDDKVSPRPWGLAKTSNSGVLLVRGNGDIRSHPQSHVQIVPAEDGQFIVRAVNAHDALVETLTRYGRHDRTCPEDDWQAVEPRCRCGYADALAKALRLAEAK